MRVAPLTHIKEIWVFWAPCSTNHTFNLDHATYLRFKSSWRKRIALEEIEIASYFADNHFDIDMFHLFREPPKIFTPGVNLKIFSPFFLPRKQQTSGRTFSRKNFLWRNMFSSYGNPSKVARSNQQKRTYTTCSEGTFLLIAACNLSRVSVAQSTYEEVRGKYKEISMMATWHSTRW